MKRTLGLIGLISGAALALALGAAAAKPSGGTLLIQHQTKGCHAWSYNGNAFKAAQTAHLKRGATIKVVDNDVMSHVLIQKSGPAAKFVGKAAMSHMGSFVKVVFAKAGVYTFTTKAGEDYFKGVKTIGEDNVLTLKVVVS